MIISELNHLEAIEEENSIVGGLALATAGAGAYAHGRFIASTNAVTYTYARSGFWSSTAISAAGSQSVAV